MYRFVEICVRYDFKLCMVEVLCENTMVNILYEHVLVHKVFKTLPYVDLFCSSQVHNLCTVLCLLHGCTVLLKFV